MFPRNFCLIFSGPKPWPCIVDTQMDASMDLTIASYADCELAQPFSLKSVSPITDTIRLCKIGRLIRRFFTVERDAYFAMQSNAPGRINLQDRYCLSRMPAPGDQRWFSYFATASRAAWSSFHAGANCSASSYLTSAAFY